MQSVIPPNIVDRMSTLQEKLNGIDDKMRETLTLPDGARSKARRLRKLKAEIADAEAEVRSVRETVTPPAQRSRRKTALAPDAALKEALHIVRSAACSTAQIDWFREPLDPFERDWRDAVIRRIESDNKGKGAENVCVELMRLVSFDDAPADEEDFGSDLSGALDRWRETLRGEWEQSHQAKMRPLYDAALRDIGEAGCSDE